jgi:hypothetical protein
VVRRAAPEARPALEEDEPRQPLLRRAAVEIPPVRRNLVLLDAAREERELTGIGLGVVAGDLEEMLCNAELACGG